MVVRLPAAVLDHYRRFSLYNSPFPAHDRGHAVDLYPDGGALLSPVGGEVREVRTVGAPSRPGAAADEHLLLVSVDAAATGLPPRADGLVARLLHVDPAVEAGDLIALGDPIGTPIRSGFFDPWVGDHVHLGFRPPDRDPYRATGSLPVAVEVSVGAATWDGTGRIRAAGETFVVLDGPSAPSMDEWVGVAADGGAVLDGGLAHYAGGGALGDRHPDDGAAEDLSLLGTRVGTARGRHVDWADVVPLVDGAPATGLSLSVARGDAGVKVVCPDHDHAVGDRVSVALRAESGAAGSV